jgi:hypothetical protein
VKSNTRDEEVQATLVGDANDKMKWGVGIGVFAAVSYAVLGATCPLCLIASPALIGAGLIGRAKARRSEEEESERLRSCPAPTDHPG